VDPPAEASVGNGINSWSAWHNWTITVNVHCDANSGVITTRKSRTRGNAQWGDTFDDGFRLMLELKEGEANTVVCRALSTHPLVDRDDTAVGVPKKTSAARFLSTQESSR
jgi:hypothetical protein